MNAKVLKKATRQTSEVFIRIAWPTICYKTVYNPGHFPHAVDFRSLFSHPLNALLTNDAFGYIMLTNIRSTYVSFSGTLRSQRAPSNVSQDGLAQRIHSSA